MTEEWSLTRKNWVVRGFEIKDLEVLKIFWFFAKDEPTWLFLT
jgi:hypothetical protein